MAISRKPNVDKDLGNSEEGVHAFGGGVERAFEGCAEGPNTPAGGVGPFRPPTPLERGRSVYWPGDEGSFRLRLGVAAAGGSPRVRRGARGPPQRRERHPRY